MKLFGGAHRKQLRSGYYKGDMIINGTVCRFGGESARLRQNRAVFFDAQATIEQQELLGYKAFFLYEIEGNREEELVMDHGTLLKRWVDCSSSHPLSLMAFDTLMDPNEMMEPETVTDLLQTQFMTDLDIQFVSNVIHVCKTLNQSLAPHAIHLEIALIDMGEEQDCIDLLWKIPLVPVIDTDSPLFDLYLSSIISLPMTSIIPTTRRSIHQQFALLLTSTSKLVATLTEPELIDFIGEWNASSSQMSLPHTILLARIVDLLRIEGNESQGLMEATASVCGKEGTRWVDFFDLMHQRKLYRALPPSIMVQMIGRVGMDAVEAIVRGVQEISCFSCIQLTQSFVSILTYWKFESQKFPRERLAALVEEMEEASLEQYLALTSSDLESSLGAPLESLLQFLLRSQSSEESEENVQQAVRYSISLPRIDLRPCTILELWSSPIPLDKSQLLHLIPKIPTLRLLELIDLPLPEEPEKRELYVAMADRVLTSWNPSDTSEELIFIRM